MNAATRPQVRLGLKLPEVALALGVSPNTVLTMVREGRLPRPRCWHTLKIWRVAEIDAALSEWPIDGESDEAGADLGEWRAEA